MGKKTLSFDQKLAVFNDAEDGATIDQLVVKYNADNRTIIEEAIHELQNSNLLHENLNNMDRDASVLSALGSLKKTAPKQRTLPGRKKKAVEKKPQTKAIVVNGVLTRVPVSPKKGKGKKTTPSQSSPTHSVPVMQSSPTTNTVSAPIDREAILRAAERRMQSSLRLPVHETSPERDQPNLESPSSVLRWQTL